MVKKRKRPTATCKFRIPLETVASSKTIGRSSNEYAIHSKKSRTATRPVQNRPHSTYCTSSFPFSGLTIGANLTAIPASPTLSRSPVGRNSQFRTVSICNLRHPRFRSKAPSSLLPDIGNQRQSPSFVRHWKIIRRHNRTDRRLHDLGPFERTAAIAFLIQTANPGNTCMDDYRTILALMSPTKVEVASVKARDCWATAPVVDEILADKNPVNLCVVAQIMGVARPVIIAVVRICLTPLLCVVVVPIDIIPKGFLPACMHVRTLIAKPRIVPVFVE